MPTILIGADICPIEANQPYFERGDAENLFHDLLPEFAAADLVVANLECPFIERPSPIRKTGPTFGVPASCVNGIRASGIDVLCLANNHIMDHGEAGLRHTMEVCAGAGIATVGAGRDLHAAGQLLIRQLDGVRVAILAVAEHEFSIATKSAWGANPLDIMTFIRTVAEHRKEFDHLIVLFHGSDEFFVPTPRVQETCRFMIEQGASAVIVQHPHVLGGWENYKNGHIVYGQGALLMDEALYRNQASFHDGFLVKLAILPGEPPRMETVLFRQSAPAPGARQLQADDKQRQMAWLERRNSFVSDPANVEKGWQEFCNAQNHDVVSCMLGFGGVRRRLNASGLLGSLEKSKRLISMRNLAMCETHREKLQTVSQHWFR